jgi:hypothetical protein
MLRYPDDHHVEVLRGLAVPDAPRVRKAIAKRCAWLIKKIETRARTGEPISYLVDELRALVEVIGIAEASWRVEDQHDINREGPAWPTITNS